MIRKVSTRDMSRDEWLEARGRSIGGSDAAALLGLNRYTSPYALWCEKTGKITPEDISDREAVRLGNDLEEYVAKRWSEATGKRVRKDNHIIYNDGYPFAHANIDRAVVGENAGLECKTTSSWEVLQQCREGKYPDTWYVQMTHYMMITGAERWYLGVLVFGKGFFEFTLERNEEEIEALAAAERAFWEQVTTLTPPPLDGTEATQEAIRTIYRDSEPGPVADLTAVSDHLVEYIRLNERILDLMVEQDRHKAEIMQFMDAGEQGRTGNITVSWKTQTRKAFDRKAFEKEHGPIDTRFYKESTSRPFRVSVQKKEE